MSLRQKRQSSESRRAVRRRRVRKKITGTAERPRLSVYRSLNFTYAQLIEDDTGKVLGALSTKQVSADSGSTSSVASAVALGEKIGELAKSKNIEKVVFDRNGYHYHGRIAAVAKGARESGLQL